MPRTDASLLAAVRQIFAAHGPLTADAYDKLTTDLYKPGRVHLRARLRPHGLDRWKRMCRFIESGATLPNESTEPGPEELPSASRDYLAAQNDKLRRQLEKQRDLTQVFIENCHAAIEKMRPRPFPPPLMEKTKWAQDFFALRSDAQVGELTNPAWVQGVAEYNADIYAHRVQRWTDKVLTFREQDRHSLGLNTLRLKFLGDQVQGESIFPGQPFYLDMNLTDQLFRSVEVESSAILTLARHFPEVEIDAVVGNHGRVGKKGDHHARTNFDYLFYRILKLVLAGQPNIRMYISESPSMIVQHGKFIFLLNHGDNARGWNGIPFYGLERMFRRLHDLHGMIINYELVAHHHQPANLCDRIIMNGCLPGGSDLSINRMGVANLPSQKVFYFDPEHGLNRESNLYLDEPRTHVADGAGRYTQWS